MAEFCLDCYNKMHHTHFKKWQVLQAYDICEGCGAWKKTIVFFWRDALLWPFYGWHR